MKKTFLFTIMVILALLILSACSSDVLENIPTQPEEETVVSREHQEGPMISGSFPFYNNIAELSAASTYVVRAEILDERVEEVNVSLPQDSPMYQIVTIYRFSVLEVFQGDAVAGEVMEVRRLGGELNGQVVHSHHQVLTVGDELLLFMYRFEEWDLPPVLLNPLQAAYQLSSDRTEGADDLNSELESLNPDNPITLTLGDLLELQYENFGEISESFAELFEDGVVDAWRE